jgi:lambda repressor-like predicted transcriptional regulator
VAGTDPFTAADNFRRATELQEQARADLITAASKNRAEVNVRGLSRRAGLHESTLYHWIEGEVRANGNHPAAAAH